MASNITLKTHAVIGGYLNVDKLKDRSVTSVNACVEPTPLLL
jgi:hypothetical protein